MPASLGELSARRRRDCGIRRLALLLRVYLLLPDLHRLGRVRLRAADNARYASDAPVKEASPVLQPRLPRMADIDGPVHGGLSPRADVKRRVVPSRMRSRVLRLHARALYGEHGPLDE